MPGRKIQKYSVAPKVRSFMGKLKVKQDPAVTKFVCSKKNCIANQYWLKNKEFTLQE